MKKESFEFANVSRVDIAFFMKLAINVSLGDTTENQALCFIL
jgi:hypothetical protein